MSPVSPEEADARRYGGVNGNDITLTEKRTWSNNKVIEFKLRNDSLLKIQLNLVFFCLVLFFGNLTNSLTLVALSVGALALHCKYITTSIDFDTLLVVESVGVQISSKKIFSGFNSSQFLPWTTVEDVFVNEVITGQRVLYFLTFVVKEFVNGEERTREPKEFLYKYELMKVIKRIIKCQPSQGQMSTLHLSITYTHTFWTRQDKMFAMLKFQNREGAATFPQAFILTISVAENLESRIASVITKNDQNLSYEGINGMQPSMISPSPADTESLNKNVSRWSEDDKICTRVFKRSNSPNDLNSPASMTINTVACQNSLTYIDSDKSLNNTESLRSPSTSWSRNMRRKRRRDTWTNSNQTRNPTLNYNIDSELRDTSTNAIIGHSQEVFPHDFCSAQSSAKLQNKSSNNQSTINMVKAEGDEEIRRTRIGSDPISARSSDITDQVMEGLMFTIKQDEDNVKVVEEKTKMELDEVLENSEKVETKEGERSLVNSSLLRLENLVTKIEIPDKQLKDAKKTDAVSVIDSLNLHSDHSVPDHNELLDTEFLGTRWPVNEQRNFPISCTNQFPLKSSLETGRKKWLGDQVSNESFSLTDWGKPAAIGNTKENNSNDNSSVRGNDNANDDDDYNNSNKDNNGQDNDNNNNINADDITDGEVRVNMWKLLQDITRGVKVMVERISDIDIRNARRCPTILESPATSKERRKSTRSKK